MLVVQPTLKTQKRWIGKGANLDVLTEKIERFFNSKGFKTRKDALPRGYKISIVPQHVRDAKADIKVTILGRPHDFVVELSVGGLSRFSTMLGLSTILFGGGVFVLRGLKLQEALERLEKEFWVYAEEAIACVTGSHNEGSTGSTFSR
jgi:hypothetical protein